MRASSLSFAPQRKWRIAHHAKRWLYIAHRWLGIASCILFAMWFVSGLVMIYVPFPALTRAERLAGLTPIDWRLVRRPPASAWNESAGVCPPRAFVLEMAGVLPVWRAAPCVGAEIDLSAIDGARRPPPSGQAAAAIAARFGHAPVRTVTRIDRDQWTVAGGFDRHRPLWKAELVGPRGRVLYVSGKTAEVVLDTDARERFWNWLGSVPHWIYPTVLRQDNSAWRQAVMWISAPCIVAGVTGFWIGILRTRLGRRRFAGSRITPYRGWMEWHHVAGLVGGLFLICWIFSGWLSVDPFRLFASGGIDAVAEARYRGAGQPPSIDLKRLGQAAAGAKRVELLWWQGHPLLAVSRLDPSPALIDARTLRPFAIDRRALVAAASQLVPSAAVASAQLLTEADSYWYEVGEPPMLPVLRVAFDDPPRTWVHVDPRSGQLLGTLDARRRLYRWLFDLLHKWDLNLLTLHRPAWDLVLWSLSLMGIVTSVSGIRVGWTRLTRKRGGRPPAE